MKLYDTLAGELIKLYPELRERQIHHLLEKYIPAVLNELCRGLIRPANDNNEISFSLTNIDQGIITYQKKRYTIHKFMSRSPVTRLIDVKFSGNIGKLSRVVFNELYKEQIMNEILEMSYTPLTPAQQQELLKRANTLIPVDAQSLANYIIQSRSDAQRSSGAYQEKVMINLRRANELMGQIQEYQGSNYLAEYRETADSGRQYGHGLSLQIVSKELRHAVLGPCHQYDFQAHSFAVMASIARAIDPTVICSQISEYIRNRTVIRQRIARDVGVSESVIKSIFTSLGFAARPVNNPFNSIRRALPSDDAYNRLINQTEFRYITEELAKINQVILNCDDFTGDFVGAGGYTYTSTITDSQGRTRRKTDSQRLAWIYQNFEAQITQNFIQLVQAASGQVPLTTVHDCVYYAQPVPANVLVDAQVQLRELYEFVRIEHTPIWPISTDTGFTDRFQEHNHQNQEHLEFIRQEESFARGYAGDWNTHAPAKSWNEPLTELQPNYEEYEYEYQYDWRNTL